MLGLTINTAICKSTQTKLLELPDAVVTHWFLNFITVLYTFETAGIAPLFY